MMTVSDFLKMYDGGMEIAVRLYEVNTEERVEFLHDNRMGIAARFANAEIESWSIRTPENSEAAFEICLAIIT